MEAFDTRFDFQMAFCGRPGISRAFFLARLPPGEETRLTVREGQGLGVFDARSLQTEALVAPYDGYALWLHMHRDRLTARG
ncbi:MAG: hypothetical protein PW843_00440 [Azospirillaceae bacterium]|nr:hypothetical protein [Azospirillaceae bacterium]